MAGFFICCCSLHFFLIVSNRHVPEVNSPPLPVSVFVRDLKHEAKLTNEAERVLFVCFFNAADDL